MNDATLAPAGPSRDDADPRDLLETALGRARAADAAGDARAALAALEEAPATARAFGMWHFARGALLFRLGDLGAAIASLREAVRREPEVPEFASNLGAALAESARRGGPREALEEAIAILCDAAAREPRTPLVHNNLGIALQAAGRHEEALAAFDAALAIDARSVPALYNRAATLHLLREEECLAALDATLAVDPDFEPARRSRERALARRRD